VTPWSPFSGAPREGIVLSVGQKCYVCGGSMPKGARVAGSRQVGDGRQVPSYPKFGGTTGIHRTYRHLDCRE
jgi:hypothetical protein